MPTDITEHPSFGDLDAVDWDNTASILTAAEHLFDAVTGHPGLLADLLDHLTGDPALRAMCEGYDFMDKLVLYDSPDHRIRLRLHRYRPGYFDRPHNHRWPFASRILRGTYLHRLYGSDEQFTEDTDPDQLTPLLERVEHPGSTYALHHTSVHTVQAEADSISLLLRGPAAKDRFLILDKKAGGSFWVYGAAQESPETRTSKIMKPVQLDQTITQVRTLLTDAQTEQRR
ncbi:hypothetical protein [Actinoplanes sp. NBRC 103695]|uniref:hypothetical protein n=1 Tax=Actinoplanes sp. NBRC 103695 TaxID=3032202 RepID=UPI0024A3A27B|nr:hypothetical protein [Actinoplanes sp. NBRC 103695]GLY99803.1 hypothetical protein Acsp02_70560 [Actinoplanes sp. NBRC 103695]